MSIKENKKRIVVVVTKEMKALLEKLAEQEKRSLSNYVSTKLESLGLENE